MKTSRINGLYRMSIEARIDMLATRGFIGPEDAKRLKLGNALLPLETADRMIENVIGRTELGICTEAIHQGIVANET